MAGIYIHIPFCNKKCNYCNFYSIASKKHINRFVECLLQEIDIQKNYLSEETIETIYFGGGTPSVLDEFSINEIIIKIKKLFNVSKTAEITFEFNPDDITKEIISSLYDIGINRISIGIQSFNDEDLKYLGRRHNADQSEKSIIIALEKFDNISIDFIYGMPSLTDKMWKSNLEKAFSYNIPHISAYILTIEEGTLLQKNIENGILDSPDENQSIRQLEILMELCTVNNYEHYEISNFCKSEYHSKHNSSYWKRKKYLGLGPSAHSYDIYSRQWNISNITEYMNSINNLTINAEKEILTEDQKYNEYILTSLRTIWGSDLVYIKEKFGEDKYLHSLMLAEEFKKKSHITISGNKLLLSKKGKLYADGIASEFFYI